MQTQIFADDVSLGAVIHIEHTVHGKAWSSLPVSEQGGVRFRPVETATLDITLAPASPGIHTLTVGQGYTFMFSAEQYHRHLRGLLRFVDRSAAQIRIGIIAETSA